jgi:putative Ca2+/H+ antiporter (TMEM165/GDT1 family)
MTLLVFLGVVVSLLILRLIPGLMLRLVMAIPRRRLIAAMASMTHWVLARRVGIVLSRKSSAPQSCTQLVLYRAPAPRRGRLVLVSSSLLVLAFLFTTAFWTWHSTGLMMLLR